MGPLTDEQWTSLFQQCRRYAWHLEAHDLYGVDDEKGRFARFLATGQRDHQAEDAERRHWLDLMRTTTRAGKQVRRVRLVSEPLNDYMRFCYAGSQLNIDAGEDIRWLPRSQASRLVLPGNDFWLFDGERVLFNHFTGDGRSAGHELATDSEAVQLCVNAFEAAWTTAGPHADYHPL